VDLRREISKQETIMKKTILFAAILMTVGSAGAEKMTKNQMKLWNEAVDEGMGKKGKTIKVEGITVTVSPDGSIVTGGKYGDWGIKMSETGYIKWVKGQRYDNPQDVIPVQYCYAECNNQTKSKYQKECQEHCLKILPSPYRDRSNPARAEAKPATD